MAAVEWFVFKGPDKKQWRVILTDEPVDEEAELSGLCAWDSRTIYVSTRQSETCVDETFLHEACHLALIDVADVRFHELGADYSKWYDEGQLAEERCIYPMSARLWPMLKRIGVPLPAKPDAWKTMNRRRRPAKKSAA